MKPNLIFIGMPGAGKSTLAKMLADQLGRPFLDTDANIEKRYGKPLQALLDEHGYLKMRELEADTITALQPAPNTLVATGGSVVYSDDAMQHLKRNGIAIYLSAQPETLRARINNLDDRGFNCPPGKNFEEVYQERLPLYRRYADVTVQVDGQSVEQLLPQLAVALMGYL